MGVPSPEGSVLSFFKGEAAGSGSGFAETAAADLERRFDGIVGERAKERRERGGERKRDWRRGTEREMGGFYSVGGEGGGKISKLGGNREIFWMGEIFNF